jgi:hypothetical protein
MADIVFVGCSLAEAAAPLTPAALHRAGAKETSQ